MNATIFVLFVMMKYDPSFLDFRTVKFESIEQCEAVRTTLKTKEPEIYSRSFCGSLTRVFSKEESSVLPVEDAKEPQAPAETEVKPKECHREKGYAENKPCALI